jgi:RNA polymerase sigma-70 factor (ECF subfamily)
MDKADLELLKQAQGGDADAFAQLFESMRPTVIAVAVRLVGASDADDVVMDTFLRAWQALPRFKRRSSLSTWLYRIAHNCAVDLIRKRRPGQVSIDAAADDGRSVLETEPDRGIESPDQDVIRRETVLEVQAALQKIPEEHRVVLQLRYSDGLAYRDIAAATGVSIGTVMSRIFYAKRKLMGVLKNGDA